VVSSPSARLSQSTELIILHLLFATSALASATSPRGRMLILDESGNALDAPNLRQIADKFGLTMLLACLDLIHQPGFRTLDVHDPVGAGLDTGRAECAARHSLGRRRPSARRFLEQYLLIGRPGAHAPLA
jgi:hypothetical protein